MVEATIKFLIWQADWPSALQREDKNAVLDAVGVDGGCGGGQKAQAGICRTGGGCGSILSGARPSGLLRPSGVWMLTLRVLYGYMNRLLSFAGSMNSDQFIFWLNHWCNIYICLKNCEIHIFYKKLKPTHLQKKSDCSRNNQQLSKWEQSTSMGISRGALKIFEFLLLFMSRSSASSMWVLDYVFRDPIFDRYQFRKLMPICMFALKQTKQDGLRLMGEHTPAGNLMLVEKYCVIVSMLLIACLALHVRLLQEGVLACLAYSLRRHNLCTIQNR